MTDGGTGTARAFRRAGQIARLLPLVALVLLPDLAQAQERRGLIDMLFGGPPRRYIDERPRRGTYPPPRYYIDPPNYRGSPGQRRKRQGDEARRSSGRKPAAAAAAAATAAASARQAIPEPPAPVEKAADAKVVLVIGDFLAASLAKGLAASLSQRADIRVVDRSDGSSGLVRDDHLDWNGAIGGLIEAEKPAAVIVMLGSNDRQAIRRDGEQLAPRSEPWVAEYTARMEALATHVRETNVPLVWVGMPAFKSSRMNDDMAYLNELFRETAVGAGGEFVDVWDGFVDADGAFSATGPDTAGQPARLRNSDGITMTDAGAEKLAFFAEKPVFRLLGTGADAGPVVAKPGETPGANGVPLPNPANATSIAAIALADPALDGGEQLLGASAQRASAPTEPSPRDKLVLGGQAASAAAGRADAFGWNGKGAQVTPPVEPPLFRGTVDLKEVRAGSAQGPQPPKPMPSLEEAIIDDWANQQKSAAEARDKAAAQKPPAP